MSRTIDSRTIDMMKGATVLGPGGKIYYAATLPVGREGLLVEGLSRVNQTPYDNRHARLFSGDRFLLLRSYPQGTETALISFEHIRREGLEYNGRPVEPTQLPVLSLA